jgi:hypothetical protein
MQTLGGNDNPDRSRYFSGVFDGNNKSINVSIDLPNGGTGGVFGIVGRYGIIKNLEVQGRVRATTYSDHPQPIIGGIVAINYGIIEYCINRSEVVIRAGGGEGDHAGGIAGNNFGQVRNCVNFGNVTVPFHDAGGIVGSSIMIIHYNPPYSYIANPGSIVNCVNFGDVSAPNSAGGIVSVIHVYTPTLPITRCINFGSVIGGKQLNIENRTLIGGIAG